MPLSRNCVPRRSPHLWLVLAAAGATNISSAAAGQDENNVDDRDTEPVFADSERTKLNFSINGGGEHQFETDIDDDNGSFDATRFSLGVGVSFAVNRQLTLAFNFGYVYDGYDFSGSTGLGMMDPWDDVHTFRGAVRATWTVNEQWAIFGGPMVSVSAEGGADYGDAVTGGGLVGFSYRANEQLTIGLGVGVLSQIEDDAAIFPIIVLNWQPADNWRITTSGSPGASGGGGVEVGWTFLPEWTASIGARYTSRRFRLDDSGIAVDGVGEETSLPIYGRLIYRPTPAAEVGLIAGVAVAGEIALETSNGTTITEEDFDPAPFIGLQFSVRF